MKEINDHRIFNAVKQHLDLPFEDHQATGFQSPALDCIQSEVELYSYLVKQPLATMLIKVNGNSMQESRVYNRDILVVDCSLEADFGDVVLAIVNGEYTVRRYHKIGLVPDDPRYPTIKFTDGLDVTVVGVVTYVIHCLK